MDKYVDKYVYSPKTDWTIPLLCVILCHTFRNIDYGKTAYCHKRKNPFRIP